MKKPATQTSSFALWFTSKAAAQYLTENGVPRSVATLNREAYEGTGSRFHKIGCRRMYRREDLDAWLAAKLGTPVQSIAEYKARQLQKEAA
jgi:hypothetical protein